MQRSFIQAFVHMHRKHLFLLSFLFLSACASAPKPWYGPDQDAKRQLEYVLKQGKKVKFAVVGRAAAEFTAQEFDEQGIEKESWETTRVTQENERIGANFDQQFSSIKNYERVPEKTLADITVRSRLEKTGQPLEMEAAQIARSCGANYLLYWSLVRSPYGASKILDKMVFKFIEVQTGRTLSVEAFQEAK